MMFFDERRQLSRPQLDSDPCRRIDEGAGPLEFTIGGTKDHRPLRKRGALPRKSDWKTERVLHAANDKLQELLQLFYLLGRDPSVPSDARYHVTVAQSEVALLARLMRNTTEAREEILAHPEAIPGTSSADNLEAKDGKASRRYTSGG